MKKTTIQKLNQIIDKVNKENMLKIKEDILILKYSEDSIKVNRIIKKYKHL